MSKNILIKSVHEIPDEVLLELVIIKNGEERIEKISISKEIGKNIKKVCAKRPFKNKDAEEYSFWITGVGNNEKLVRENGVTVKIIRSNPKLYLLISRGKSRLKDEVVCNVQDWESIHRFTLEAMSSDVLAGIENYGSSKEYQWA